MNAKAERLVRLSATIVAGDWDAVRALRAAAPEGEPDRAWREVVLQSHLFAGFPRVVEAFEVLDEAGGLGTWEAGEDESDWSPARGDELFERIYGSGTDAVRERLASFHPNYAAMIREHAYTRVLTRPGLDAATRELCAVAALIVLGTDRQLASHARGAVRCGASAEDVLAVAQVVREGVEPEAWERSRAVLERFTG